MTLLPLVAEPANTMMLRFWRSRTDLDRGLVVRGAPRIAANPGHLPSTSWTPRVLRIVSVKNPLHPGWALVYR